jgi:hypothetical protein
MKRASLLASFFTLAIILGIGVGCARKPDDAKISSDIQSKFSQDSGLSSKQLTVQAHDGVVTLAGMVDNDAQRDAASRQAATVEGVRTVVNNLQIGTGPTVIAKASPKPPMQASTQPVVKAKPAPGKKSSRARADDAGAAGDSANDSNTDETSASNQDPPDAAAQAPPPPPDNTQTPPSPKRLIIDQGTQVTVRLIDPIDSERNQTGDAFHATLNAALTSDGEEAVPAGVELTGHLVEVKSAGKFAGQSAVVLQLDSLSLGGKTYSLQTDQYRKEGNSRGKNTAEKVGGGAIIGGIIGAIAGGGKGAAIGTAAGAGVGGGVQAASKGQQIKLPSETVLNFVLQEPIEVVPASPADANRPKLEDSQ